MAVRLETQILFCFTARSVMLRLTYTIDQLEVDISEIASKTEAAIYCGSGTDKTLIQTVML